MVVIFICFKKKEKNYGNGQLGISNTVGTVLNKKGVDNKIYKKWCEAYVHGRT